MNEIYKKLILQILNDNTKYYHKKRNTYLLQNFNISFTIKGTFYPLLTTRKFNPYVSIAEAIWILKGQNNIKELKEYTKIWNNFFDGQDTYGYRLINKDINQIKTIIQNFKENPNSKQQLWTYWERNDLLNGKIHKNIPCPYSGIFINENNSLSMQLNIRSSDIVYGLPYDILTHFIILKIVANSLNIDIKNLYINITNGHIYSNYIEENLFIELNKKSELFILPKFTYTFNDILILPFKECYETILKDFKNYKSNNIKLNSKVSEK